MSKQRLVLIGDSILDNAPYTNPHPDSATHLRQLLPQWEVQLAAQDGATMSDVAGQLRQIKSGDRTTAILSVGGNDVAAHVGVLDQPRTSSAELLEQLLRIAESFEPRYETVAKAVAARAQRTVLCTIYEVPLEPPIFARLARVPLAMLNDCIIRVGARLGLDVLDLRTVSTTPEDFVMQIEPSAQGALKIARAIASLVQGEGLSSGRVFAANLG